MNAPSPWQGCDNVICFATYTIGRMFCPSLRGSVGICCECSGGRTRREYHALSAQIGFRSARGCLCCRRCRLLSIFSWFIMSKERLLLSKISSNQQLQAENQRYSLELGLIMLSTDLVDGDDVLSDYKHMSGPQAGYSTVHYGVYGLQNCQEGSCTSQIVEIVMSVAILVWLLVEFIMQVRARLRPDFSWQEIMLILIFLCLSFNICFMVWDNIILWYVLENLMYQVYFTTLVYYFAKKYFEKIIPESERRRYIIGLLIVYAFFCLGQLGIFIFIVNEGLGHCKEIAQIVVNAVMISLGLIFAVLAYLNQRQERRKFEEYKVDDKIKNPLPNIWLWVLSNIFGQIVNEVQSGLIYAYYEGQQCYPIEVFLQLQKDNTETQILGPVFMLLAGVVPFCSTLWFYSQRRRQGEQRLSYLQQIQLTQAAQVDVQNRIELIQDSSTGSVSNTLNQVLI